MTATNLDQNGEGPWLPWIPLAWEETQLVWHSEWCSVAEYWPETSCGQKAAGEVT